MITVRSVTPENMMKSVGFMSAVGHSRVQPPSALRDDPEGILTRKIFAFLAGLLLCSVALAQSYPARPVRIIVPYATGGGSDITARLLAAKLTESLGQTVLVENRPSSSGIIGYDFVAKAAPDGYTLLLVDPGLGILPGINPKLPFDPVRDFAFVTMLITTTSVLIVHPSLPVRSVKELIALARSKPGQVTFASGGVGTPPHMNAELFKSMAKVDILHVPYKGVSGAVTDLLAGQIDMAIPALTATLPNVNAGKLRALAVTATTRASQLPQVPTMHEAGLPGYAAMLWFGLAAPAGTPKEVVARLQSESAKAFGAADVKQRLVTMGAEVVGNTPEQFGQFFAEEVRKWAAVTKAAGIRTEF